MLRSNTPTTAAIWSFIGTFSTQLVGLIIGMVLARLLTPSDYGTVALMSIFISISSVIIDSGFSNALIRKKDRTLEDLDTAFIFNVCVSIVCYFILFVSAPLIAAFFSEPILTKLIRIVGVNLIFSALCSVQNALLTSNLNIRRQTFISISSQIPSGLIAIFMAYWGWGLYALIIQTICASVVNVILLWKKTNWYPRLIFNKESFLYLWGFGSKLVLANIIGTIFDRIYSVIIGKFFSVKDLGYYGKASSLDDNSTSITRGIVSKVALPVLARNQENIDLLRNDFREMMRLLVMILAPLSAFLFFNSDNIIIILFSKKWIESSVYFRLLVIGSMWLPISQLSQLLMHAVNRTDIILKLEIPKKVLYIVYILIGLNFGIIGLCLSQIVINISAAIINMLPTYSILRYNYFAQMFDVVKYMIIAYTCGFLVNFLQLTEFLFINVFIFILFFFPLYYLLLYLIKDKIAKKYEDKIFEKMNISFFK